MSEQSSDAGTQSKANSTQERPARASIDRGWLWVGMVLVVAVAIAVTFYLNAPPRTVKLALVTWNQDPFWDPLIRGAQDAATRANADLEVIRSKPDAESQNAHLRDLLSRGIEGIAVSLNNPVAQASVLDEVASKATLITFDADAPQSKRKHFVGIENYGTGHLTAAEVREALPDGGAVIISVGSIDMLNGRDRRQGLIDSLLDRPYKPDQPTDPLDAELKGSKYSIAATVVDGGDPAKATALITDALRKHPEVKCVVGLYSYSGPAAVAAIDAAGRSGSVEVICFDELDATQAAIEAGKIRASMIQDQYRCGDEAIRLLAETVRGTHTGGPEVPRTVVVPTLLLHKENMDQMRQFGQIRTPKEAAPTTAPTTAPAS